MDKYLGLVESHPACLRGFARRENVEPLQIGTFYGNDAADPEQAVNDYALLLTRYPADLCFMGIGENEYLTFNHPPSLASTIQNQLTLSSSMT